MPIILIFVPAIYLRENNFAETKVNRQDKGEMMQEKRKASFVIWKFFQKF